MALYYFKGLVLHNCKILFLALYKDLFAEEDNISVMEDFKKK